ncbi:efflux RND transporter periplasmic adaptor subunit [Methylocystis echinoides]|jgi:HlyD family secretion protein|uniref:HlyD family secretion protein n=1 Tax=Methylocystis echinoides TaxID=29468 RepID=UPI003426FFD0
MKLSKGTAIAIVVAFSAVALWFGFGGTPEATSVNATSSRASTPEVTPHVAVAPGLIEPLNEEREVAAEANGILREVRVEENDEVTAGEVIAIVNNAEQAARLDSARAELALRRAELDKTVNGARPEQRREAQAALSEAHAGLDYARREYDRRAPLVKSGVSPKAVLDKAASDLDVAKARAAAAAEKLAAIEAGSRSEDIAAAQAHVDLAKANVALASALLDKTLIRSPISGIVLRRMRLGGESVSATPPTPIAIVGNINGLQVRAEVDETDAARVKVGQRVEILADAFPGKKFRGTVYRVASRMGAKQIQTGRPADKLDAKILQAFIHLDPNVRAPIGLRVDAYFLTPAPPLGERPLAKQRMSHERTEASVAGSR